MVDNLSISQVRCCLLFLCLLVCTLSACKKEDPLPTATQSGVNTFGCKINGKTWIPDGGGGFSGIKPLFGGYVDTLISPVANSVYISAYKSDKTKIDLHLQGVNKIGVYPLNQYSGMVYAFTRPLNYGAYFPDPAKAFVTNPTYQGTITVTRADTINKIISGTFSFTVYDPESKQTIHITEGRFDFNQKRQ
jgi:hypothetical protein